MKEEEEDEEEEEEERGLGAKRSKEEDKRMKEVCSVGE